MLLALILLPGSYEPGKLVGTLNNWRSVSMPYQVEPMRLFIRRSEGQTMKKAFYKIPEGRMDTMYTAAAKCDRNDPRRMIVQFLEAWLGDREEFRVEEDVRPIRGEDPNQTIDFYEDDPGLDEIETLNHGQAAELDADAECGDSRRASRG